MSKVYNTMRGGKGGFGFNKIVVTVAVILLIISLIVVAASAFTKRHKKKFPPVSAECPDYWADMSKGDASDCRDINGVGGAHCPKTMNFARPEFRGAGGLCAKVNWARRCNVTWDGVTHSARAGSC